MKCSKSRKRVAIIVGSTLITISLIGLVILSVLFALTKEVRYRNAVVLDAGSTSTKLTLYSWRDDPFRTNGQVKQVKHLKVSPGISDYIDKPFNAYKELSTPLSKLVENIPIEERGKTPLYLAATAGMRLQLVLRPLESMELFEVLRKGLLTSGLKIVLTNERIRLLSGSEEGFYGWASVNYFSGKITASKQENWDTTTGSLDLGGASTQIAFVPDSKPSSPEDMIDYYSLNLFGKKYEVYSHSFLCYGKNEFEKRLWAKLIVNQSDVVVRNPCMNAGYTIKQNIQDIFMGPCSNSYYAKQVFGRQYIKPVKDGSVTFIGTGNPLECVSAIADEFNRTTCSIPPCSFNNIHQPQIRGPFQAYSGFSYVMTFLFPHKKNGFTASEVEDAISKFCTTSWEDLTKTYSPLQLKFMGGYCFDGFYILNLLNNYGFQTDDSWKRINFGDTINNESVSWALGYMLDQSGLLPSESPKVHVSDALFGGLFCILILILLASIIWIVITLCCGKNS